MAVSLQLNADEQINRLRLSLIQEVSPFVEIIAKVSAFSPRTFLVKDGEIVDHFEQPTPEAAKLIDQANQAIGYITDQYAAKIASLMKLKG